MSSAYESAQTPEEVTVRTIQEHFQPLLYYAGGVGSDHFAELFHMLRLGLYR
jgi:hypothetical protein